MSFCDFLLKLSLFSGLRRAEGGVKMGQSHTSPLPSLDEPPPTLPQSTLTYPKYIYSAIPTGSNPCSQAVCRDFGSCVCQCGAGTRRKTAGTAAARVRAGVVQRPSPSAAGDRSWRSCPPASSYPRTSGSCEYLHGRCDSPKDIQSRVPYLDIKCYQLKKGKEYIVVCISLSKNLSS